MRYTETMLNTDTTYDTAHGDLNFPPAGYRVAWKDVARAGQNMWSQVYTPDPAAIAWDGAAPGSLAIGSRHGIFSYVTVKVTGRGPVRVPRTGDYTLGMKARLTFSGSGETVDAWIVK